MKYLWMVVTTSLFIISSLPSETQMVDVTGDGVDDEIKIGEQSVVVIDGMSGKRFPVVTGEEMLDTVRIDDYHSGIPGKEIAVIFWTGPWWYSKVYGFKNGQFVLVSEELPGKIEKDLTAGIVWGYFRCLPDWGGGIYETRLPCPIIEEGGILKTASIKKDISKTITIDAGTTKEISIDVSKNTCLVCIAIVEDKNVKILLKDEEGSTIAEGKIDPESRFIDVEFTYERDRTFTLVIDNSYSVITPKTVFYRIVHYNISQKIKRKD